MVNFEQAHLINLFSGLNKSLCLQGPPVILLATEYPRIIDKNHR